MCISKPCLQTTIHNNLADNGGERESVIQRRDTGIEIEWYGIMDDSGVI
jgi:hypothetical protein